MGIPGVNSWFKSQYREAYVDLAKVRVDHLYVDMNSVLHLVLRRARTMHQFYMLLFQKCDFILNSCSPRKSVMFALDGPAPVAKLLTQRIRRKRVSLTASDKKGKTVSPLALTPGTPFMQEVHEALSYFICQRLIGSKWRHLRMELSGSTVQGEGECKILARLQQPVAHVQPDDSHALIGNDSDLLMMSLMADCRRVYVLGQILDSRQNLPSSSEKLKVFSVEKLRGPLLRQVPRLKEAPEKLNHSIKHLQHDLAITCILSRGNDYLPSVGGVSLDRVELNYQRPKREDGLWSTYLKLRSQKDFAKRSLSHRLQGGIQLDYEFLYQLFKESGIGSAARPVNESRKEPDPDHYLSGLKWLLEMYTKGTCPDYRYVYDAVGPSSKELCEAILRQTQKSTQLDVRGNGTKMPLKPSECALALLPYQAQRYVPKPLQHLMEPNSPIGDLFQDCDACVEISERNSRVHREYMALNLQMKELIERIQKLDDVRAIKLNQRLQTLQDEASVLRTHLREISAEREAHNNEKHPYEPFPVHRIEEAVRNVPVSKFNASDHELFSFGAAHFFQRTRHGALPPHNKRLALIHENAPEPPSNKFKRFKVPLPIMRGRYPSDHVTIRGLSTCAGRVLSLARRLPV